MGILKEMRKGEFYDIFLRHFREGKVVHKIIFEVINSVLPSKNGALINYKP